MHWLPEWAPDLTHPVVKFAVPVAFPVTCLAALSVLSPGPSQTAASPARVALVVHTVTQKLDQAAGETVPERRLDKSRHALGIVDALVAMHGRAAVDDASGVETASVQKQLRSIVRQARAELAKLRMDAQRANETKWLRPVASEYRR